MFFRLYKKYKLSFLKRVNLIFGTGFSVHFKDSSNASISRNFNFTAVGFGKGV